KSGDAVLAVDDEELAAGFAEVAHRLVVAERLELERLVGEEQDGAGDEGLRRGGLEEVDDGPHLAPVQRSLKRAVALLDRGDELGDLVVAGRLGGDRLPFEVEP